MAKINKKQLNELLALSHDPDIQLLEDLAKSYKIMIIGVKDKVKKSNFEQIMLDFVKEQREFNKNQLEFNHDVKSHLDNMESRLDNMESRLDNMESRLDNMESRLDNIEKDVKDIKSLPTIRGQLNGTIKKEDKSCQKKQNEDHIWQ